MFKEFSEELLDLTATEKGYRHALYASVDNDGGGGSCSSTGSSSLTCCHLCW